MIYDITKKKADFQTNYLSEEEMKSIHSWIQKIKNKSIKREKGELSKHIKKARKSLRLKYQIIGNGKNRVVFDLTNGYVLKVALNSGGMKSNEKEYNLFLHSPSHIQKHLCTVKGFGYGWIIMEKMVQNVPDQEYEKKKSRLTRLFKKHGIKPKDLKKKNLALSDNGEFIVVDYGNFIFTDD